MKPCYVITADPARDLIRITVSGMFDDAALNAFIAARRDAQTRLRCGPNAHRTLVDMRDIAIQTQDMVARWAQLLADPRCRSERLAFVAASTLARKQLARALGSRDARVFDDPLDAEAWVLASFANQRVRAEMNEPSGIGA